MRSVAVGGQRLRVAIRMGPNGPGQPPRYPLLLINGIGHLGLLTEAAGLAPVVDGFLAAP
ncbi:MAG: hypothetical protein ACRDOD_03250 [Streptosporangiaceae bacterium]